MDREWNDSQPIYRQIRDRVIAMILDGVLKEGDPLPSVRKWRPNIGSIRSRF
jgi:GntR family transcriptional regulator